MLTYHLKKRHKHFMYIVIFWTQCEQYDMLARFYILKLHNNLTCDGMDKCSNSSDGFAYVKSNSGYVKFIRNFLIKI